MPSDNSIDTNTLLALAMTRIHLAKWNAAARERLEKEDIKGEFAGPNRSFPIRDRTDVKNAWNLAGHAANPDTVRRRIVAIALKYGWESGLPDAAKVWAKDRGLM